MITDVTAQRGQAHYPGYFDDEDAISLLVADHGEVKEMFAEYQELVSGGGSRRQRALLVGQLCLALKAHIAVEEEIFLPAARGALGDQDLTDQALRSYAQARTLIGQLQAMPPSDKRYDLSVRQLEQVIDRHVRQEEGELFPRVRRSTLDLESLGRHLALRKDEVFVELDDTDIDR